MIRSTFLIFILINFAALTAKAQQTLTLQEAISQGLLTNLGLQVAANDQEIARTLDNWGNAGRLPTVTGQAGYNFSVNNLDQRLSNGTNIKRNGATFRAQNAAVLAQWRIYNGGRVIAAKERLEEEVIISDLAYRQQANLVVYNIITAYLNVLRLQAQLNASKESLTLFDERMRLAENRFNIGTSAKSDYLQARSDYNEVANNMISLENSIAASKVALNVLMNKNPAETYTLTDTISNTNLGSASEVLASLDGMNPELLLRQSELKVLQHQYKEINSQRLPVVTLNAGAGLNNSNNSSGFTLRNTTYGPNSGIGIAIPIFQGGVIKQNLKVNQIQQRNQSLFIDRLRNELSGRVVTAYNNYSNASRRYQLEVENLKVVKENNFIAMERFRKASITNVELRQVQLNLIESLTRMINAQYDMKQAEADVMVLIAKLVQ